MTIAYPVEWGAQEGDRPNVVQKFGSPDRLDTVMILTKELPIALSGEDEAMFFRAENLKEMVPPGSTLVGAKSTTLERRPAGIIEFRQVTGVHGRELAQHALMAVFSEGKTLVSVLAMTGNTNPDLERATLRMGFMRPIFAHMIGKIVLPERWQDDSTTVLDEVAKKVAAQTQSELRIQTRAINRNERRFDLLQIFLHKLAFLVGYWVPGIIFFTVCRALYLKARGKPVRTAWRFGLLWGIIVGCLGMLGNLAGR